MPSEHPIPERPDDQRAQILEIMDKFAALLRAYDGRLGAVALFATALAVDASLEQTMDPASRALIHQGAGQFGYVGFDIEVRPEPAEG